MALSSKLKSDAHIMARRAYEDRQTELNTAIRGNVNSFLKAQWEQKSDLKIVKNMAHARMQDLKKRQESNIIERRAKLAALLAAEDKQYEKEFMDNLETPE